MKKSTKYFTILLAFTMWVLSLSPIKATNLINNPGFEASSTTPVNWIITGPISTMEPVTTVDNQIHFSGQYGLRMISNNPNCHGRAVQTVDITGNTSYNFTARFRTDIVGSIDKSVLIRVKWK